MGSQSSPAPSTTENHAGKPAVDRVPSRHLDVGKTSVVVKDCLSCLSDLRLTDVRGRASLRGREESRK